MTQATKQTEAPGMTMLWVTVMAVVLVPTEQVEALVAGEAESPFRFEPPTDGKGIVVDVEQFFDTNSLDAAGTAL